MQTSAFDQAQYSVYQDLGNLETVDARYRYQSFSRHVHEGYCIGVIESGAQQFFAHGRKNTAPADSIILVNADQVHDGSCASENGWTYKAMYPLPDAFAAVCEDLYGNRNYLPWFPEAVQKDRLLATRLRQFFQLMSCSKNSLAREIALLDIFSLLMKRHARQRPDPGITLNNARPVKTVCDFLQDNLEVNTSLKTLSNLTGLNSSYLTRVFKHHTGLPPHAWQNQQRIRKARQLIRCGHTLSDIAAHCGFTDQSHLNRHFKRTCGVTPGEYASCYGLRLHSRSPSGARPNQHA